MSGEPDEQPPAAGEEIHVPTPSLAPLMLAIGLTLTLVGITTTLVLTGVGIVITVPTLVRWIRHSREEYSGLPPGR